MRANRPCNLAVLLVLAVSAGPSRCAEPLSEDRLYDRAVRASAWVVVKQESGAAILVDAEERLLVTNYHVVKDAEEVAVIFPQFVHGRVIDDRDFYWKNWKRLAATGRVIHRNVRCDLAVIQVDQLPSSARPAGFANRPIRPGDKVFRVGSPGAAGEAWQGAQGVVQSVGMHRLRYHSGQVASCSMVEDDAPPVPGHSGAGVLNAEGEIAAIHAAGEDSTGWSMGVEARVVEQFLKEARASAPTAPVR